jgi:N4-gp56 family major capsid protein
MARTTVIPTDPLKRKAWSAQVAADSTKEQYYSRLIGPEGSYSAIIKKTDAEKGATDEIVTALVAKLRGAPVIEGQKLAGREFRLQHASHTMRINEWRQGVNIGARIDQSRIGYNLRKQGREKLTDYIKEMTEEVITMVMCGARGVGDEIQHFDTEYTGYPNALRAPDPAHLFVGTVGDKAKATLTAGDKLSLETINKLRVKSKKMLGGAPDKAVKMATISMGGKKCNVLVTSPEGVQDIRSDAGAQGWFEAQRALVTSIGKDAELFKGGAGWFNGVLVDEAETCVKFGDYGAAGNLPAGRSLFLGANAGFVAYGTKGMADGMTVALDEDTDDRKHDSILFFEMIMGADKTAYYEQDYGLISVDHAYTAAA